MRKKTAGILLALMLFFVAVSGIVLAAEEYTEGALKYTVSGGSATITGYFGVAEKVDIPASIGGNPVNTIGKNAFYYNEAKEIRVPTSVIHIEAEAVSPDVTIIYKTENLKPENIRSGDIPKDTPGTVVVEGKTEEPDADNTEGAHNYYKEMQPGEKTIVGERILTVTEAGSRMTDQEGNQYTIDDAGNILDANGDMIAEAFMNYTEEADLSEENGTETETATPARMGIIAGICIVVIAGAGAVFYVIRKKKK